MYVSPPWFTTCRSHGAPYPIHQTRPCLKNIRSQGDAGCGVIICCTVPVCSTRVPSGVAPNPIMALRYRVMSSALEYTDPAGRMFTYSRGIRRACVSSPEAN